MREFVCHYMKKHIPVIDDPVHPDEWVSHSILEAGSTYSDSSFPGCEFYLNSDRYHDIRHAVNVKVTGKPHFVSADWFKSRVKIEFVGDGEPSTFCGGWIFHGEGKHWEKAIHDAIALGAADEDEATRWLVGDGE